MKRRLLRIGLVGGIAASAALAANLASAAPPASVRGSWVILIDQTYTTLDLNQGGPGAPGAALCRVIVGSLDIAPIRGFYCPDSGRIHFLHNNVSTGATVRTFTGSVTDATASAPAQMTGTFNVLAAAFGDYGEYPFSATK